MTPTLTPNMYKVIDNLHMPVNGDLDELSCLYHHTCVEALNPHVMEYPVHPHFVLAPQDVSGLLLLLRWVILLLMMIGRQG